MIIEIPKSFEGLDNNVRKNIYLTLLKDKLISNIKFEDINWKTIDNKMQCVVLVNNDHKHIVIFTPKLNNLETKKAFQSEGRNTFLLQNFISCYYYSRENNINNISYSINFNNINDIDNLEYDKSKLITKSLYFNLRELTTIGIKINETLKSFTAENPINGFNDLNDFLDDKYIIKNKSANKEALKWSINYDEGSLYVYSKNKGATRGEVIVFLLVLKKLLKDANYKIKFVSLENENKKDFEKLRKIFKDDITFENLNEINNELSKDLSKIFEKTSSENEYNKLLKRAQEVFKINIIKKYFNEEDFQIDRCFCCNYILGKSLIRSHIHRFVDIEREFIEKILNKDEALNLNISGANGFLLCPNHDKMFEKGEIVFDLNYLKNNTKKPFIVNKKNKYVLENENVRKFIEDSLQQHPNMFKSIIKDPTFINNVTKHHKRVNWK